MIRVDRDRVTMPAVLGPAPDAPGILEREMAARFFAQPIESRRQRRFGRFKVYTHPEVKAALKELFRGKCAYCEGRYSVSQPMDAEHFRPKDGVAVAGELKTGYWWLASEWTNLYAVCIDCGRVRDQDVVGERVRSGKGDRFPLADEACRATAPGQEAEEEPLLLDPCVDDPEEHLVFTDDGLVVSETPRGRTTIEVLGLNRAGLVARRREAATRIQVFTRGLRSDLESVRSGEQIQTQIGQEVAELVEQTEPDQEFAALKRQLIRRALVDLGLAKASAGIPGERAPITLREQQRVASEFLRYQRSQDDYSLDNVADREKYFSKRRLVERIEVRNLRAVRDVKLDLTASGGSTPWTMFLGENGTGKSTVLQALALALCGARYYSRLAERFAIEPAGFVRTGCKSGSIKVYLTPDVDRRIKPHTLTFFTDRLEFKSASGRRTVIRDGVVPTGAGEAWGIQVLLLGYGATRLLPRAPERDKERSKDSDFAKLENLFDPFVPLIDARRWMLGLPQDRFDYTARALKTLLDLRDRDVLIREDGEVWLKSHRSKVPLERLSDGYQSIIALTADILDVVLELWDSPELAEGVVLVDEIATHLHPTWKLRIVSTLRQFLPRMQFIATTHDPLSLRGLADGEVVVMRRDARGRSMAITDLPSVAGLRADQLLTSEFFGLSSTLDPAYQRLFEKTYALRRRDDRTPEEDQELDVLRASLDALGMMGRTRRERLMLEAIDDYLAREPEDLEAKALEAGERRLRQSLADILGDLEEV